MKVILMAILIAMTTVFIYSCGEDDTKKTEDTNRTGITKCGQDAAEHECKAGQYCADETFGTCENGCLSDNNCLYNQTCKIVGNLGTCQNNVVTQNCTEGAKRCNANSVETCTNDAWTVSQACGTMTCDATTNTCKDTTTENSCTAMCNKVITCTTAVTFEQCTAQCAGIPSACQVCMSTATCVGLDNETECATECGTVTTNCTEGEKRCNANSVEVCASDAWTVSQACGTMTCDATTNTCKDTTTENFDTLMDSCATSLACKNGYSCVRAADGSTSDDGICVAQCGTYFDCEKFEGQKGYDSWECNDEVQGVSGGACTPFAWGF